MKYQVTRGYITNRAFYHKRTIELKRFGVLLVLI